MPPAAGGRPSRSRSGAPADRHHQYAGLVSRWCALAVDLAIVASAAGATASLPPLVWQEVTGTDAQWLAAASTLVAAALPWTYFTACWWLGGRTVGALLLGLMVTRPDGGRLGIVRAGARAAAGLFLAPVWLAGMLNVLFDAERRAWHDLVFNTVVRYHAGAPERSRR
ncbi:RDD family protein [Luedemannella helvata]|uniref:RDD domain-containing protein n=1 Tax=Luedemannella helvata TaxID=349315 RepID=A0ABP4WZD0_9ACTN